MIVHATGKYERNGRGHWPLIMSPPGFSYPATTTDYGRKLVETRNAAIFENNPQFPLGITGDQSQFLNFRLRTFSVSGGQFGGFSFYRHDGNVNLPTLQGTPFATGDPTALDVWPGVFVFEQADPPTSRLTFSLRIGYPQHLSLGAVADLADYRAASQWPVPVSDFTIPTFNSIAAFENSSPPACYFYTEPTFGFLHTEYPYISMEFVDDAWDTSALYSTCRYSARYVEECGSVSFFDWGTVPLYGHKNGGVPPSWGDVTVSSVAVFDYAAFR